MAKLIVSVGAVLSCLGLFAGTAYAAGASFYLAPTSGGFSVGDTFTVSIYLNTNGNSINALRADLSFPPNKLQVVSPSSGTSFVQTWVAQPTYSNSKGTLNFAGAIPNPGINTDSGLLSTITFRAMETGIAVVKFLDTSRVLLNDGRGTDVLSSKTDGIYTFALPPPAGPSVTSPTNPDQTKWYKTDAAVLRWSSYSDVQGFSYSLDDNPLGAPDDVSEGTQNGIGYRDLLDGVHYFHIKAMRAGVWGGVSSYVLQVDNTSPAAFKVEILPGDYTANKNPVIQFQTTDAISGIGHYDLKFIPLDPTTAEAAQGNTPFFIEANSPYTQNLAIGRYDVLVRAYDIAGNYYQATERLAIVSPFFELVDQKGVRVMGTFTLSWPYVAVLFALILALLFYALRKFWRLHRDMGHQLELGAAGHPEIAEKLAELKAKQAEYDSAVKKISMIILLFAVVSYIFLGTHYARAADVPLTPPIINLSPSSLGNNEILYVGGLSAPAQNVIVHVQDSETGEVFSGAVTSGADGNWLYSLPKLLNPGHYIAWAEIKVAGVSSPLSNKVNILVAPTAIQIGGFRMDYSALYGYLFVLSSLVALILFIGFLYHSYHFRLKKMRFMEVVHSAEESLRRGFSVLRRDMEWELATLQKSKNQGPATEEDIAREQKLISDLQLVDNHIGKEIWKIEEEEHKL